MANYVTITSNKKKKTAFWMCVFGGAFSVCITSMLAGVAEVI